MATHDLEIVDRMKERVVVIKEGTIIRDYERGTFYRENL